ncbi:uncharacterized protein SPPG_08511 [Spizellomyces punctatus DAOM BR117]|uniref:Uncharacterized protein n=1 Tax=Spizellomyces punctatus (strain DAOM BR117) TaxID=645134 RepID=A0A0L0H5Z3_SPIPD|nr:uncharacterized protein SPPG_08511 [Spizellomyces punctatus DAOM BR117]KNC96123.1 hypothetical protein SPPG_08511 [Spizellomyces punctatus DAOM BR117]|eukprot:XP_016604163.1 hypothetical protein SPPG_08511 [Spizellomyces punctatus DAOM BR117]
MKKHKSKTFLAVATALLHSIMLTHAEALQVSASSSHRSCPDSSTCHSPRAMENTPLAGKRAAPSVVPPFANPSAVASLQDSEQDKERTVPSATGLQLCQWPPNPNTVYLMLSKSLRIDAQCLSSRSRTNATQIGEGTFVMVDNCNIEDPDQRITFTDLGNLVYHINFPGKGHCIGHVNRVVGEWEPAQHLANCTANSPNSKWKVSTLENIGFSAQLLNVESKPDRCLKVQYPNEDRGARPMDAVGFASCRPISVSTSQFWALLSTNCGTPKASPFPSVPSQGPNGSAQIPVSSSGQPKTPTATVTSAQMPQGTEVILAKAETTTAPTARSTLVAQPGVGRMLVGSTQNFLINDPISIQNSKTNPISLTLALTFLAGPIVLVGVMFGIVGGSKRLAERWVRSKYEGKY